MNDEKYLRERIIEAIESSPLNRPLDPEKVARRSRRLRARVFALAACSAVGLTAITVTSFVAISRKGENPPRVPAAADSAPRVVSTISMQNAATLAVRDEVVWAAEGQGTAPRLFRIDVASGQREAIATLDPTPVAIAASAKRVWVASIGSGTVFTLNVEGGENRNFHAASDYLLDLAATDETAWILRSAPPSLLRIASDMSSSSRVSTSLPQSTTAIAHGDGQIWAITQHDDGSIIRIDSRNLKQTGVENPSPTPLHRIVADDQAVWVTSRDRVWKLDPKSGRPMGGAMTVGGSIIDVALGPDTLWVAARSIQGDGGMEVSVLIPIDRETGAMRSPLKLEREPVDIAAEPGGAWVTTGEQILHIRMR